jgi:CBS domain-containing protein
MNVAQILSQKGREVLSAAPHLTLQQAAELLGRRRVGALVVADASGAVLGILSERDVVRALGLHGPDVLGQPVSGHMTAHPTTVGEDADLDDVMRTMTDGRFRHLPVVENGRLAGIVSIGDVVKRHVDELHHERDSLRDYIATA